MTSQSFSRQLRSNWKRYTVVFLLTVYFIINLFRLGGESFVINLNDNLAIPLAISVTLFAMVLWRHVAIGNQNRLLWSGLTIGWALWTVAEFWWGIAFFLGREVPYPSWADFFWLLGYVPMFVALWTRIQALPNKIPSLQRAAIWGSILLSSLLTLFFVIVPIIQNNNPTDILESILNTIYPVMDLVLLILVLRILFAYQQGMYGRVWGWFSAGFALHSFSNLYFSYASTANIYEAGGHVNFLSNAITDIPYNLSYLFLLIGLFLLMDIQKRHRTFVVTDTAIKLSLLPNTHIVVSTKGDDSVIDASQNYPLLFPFERVKGKSLSETLGISPADTENLLKDIKANRVLRERPLQVTTGLGQQPAWISGISMTNPQDEYSGLELLLRIFNKDYSLDDCLTDYQQGMVTSLLNKTGTKIKEDNDVKQLLSSYELAYLKAFYNCAFAEGGSIIADAFLNELQSVADQHKWDLDIRPDSLLDVSQLDLATTREALPVLLETARRFVGRITDEATVNGILENVRSQFDENIQKSVVHFQAVPAGHKQTVNY